MKLLQHDSDIQMREGARAFAARSSARAERAVPGTFVRSQDCLSMRPLALLLASENRGYVAGAFSAAQDWQLE